MTDKKYYAQWFQGSRFKWVNVQGVQRSRGVESRHGTIVQCSGAMLCAELIAIDFTCLNGYSRMRDNEFCIYRRAKFMVSIVWIQLVFLFLQ